MDTDHDWEADQEVRNGEVHVWPIDDYIEHELEGTDCVCGPQVEQNLHLLVIHNSLDGRELVYG